MSQGTEAFSLQEVHEAVRALKNVELADLEEVAGEMINIWGVSVRELCNRALGRGTTPED